MTKIRALSQFKTVRILVGWIAYLYIQLVFKTSHWTWHGEERLQPYWQTRTPIIVCFWHSRLLMVPYAWRTTLPFSMLISAHKDGEMIARTVGHLGITWIPGSSSKDGMQALRLLKRALNEGHAIGITPDGPRGPRYKVARGIAGLARLTGADILPLTYSLRRGRFLKSWDRFLLAFPFTRGVLMWGEPLRAKEYEGREEELRIDLETALLRLTQEGDALCGHTTPL